MKNRQPIPLFFSLLLTGMFLVSMVLPASTAILPKLSGGMTLPEGYVRHMRTIEAAELGLSNPIGVGYAPETNSLLVFGQQQEKGAAVARMGLYLENLDDLQPVDTSVSNPLNAAFDRASGTFTYLDPSAGQMVEINQTPAGRWQEGRRTNLGEISVQQVQGLAVDPTGQQIYLLDPPGKHITAFSAADPAHSRQISLQALGKLNNPRGIAYNPNNGHLYVLDPTGKAIYEMTTAGKAVAVLNLAELNLVDPQGMAFAPDADPTNDPAIESLYITDRGQPEANRAPAIIELSVTVVSLIQPQMTKYYTLINTIDTSQWSPPSPDPSGLSWWSAKGALLVSDGEIDKLPQYWEPDHKNVWQVRPSGRQVAAYTTQAFSTEPCGAAVNTNTNQLLFSDDVRQKVFIVDLGEDGAFNTSDDVVTSFSTKFFGSYDAEGLAYGAGDLYILDGEGSEVYRLDAGVDGIFNGVPPEGDDVVVSHFDTAEMGVADPEGIDYNKDTMTLFIVGNSTRADLIETTIDGQYVSLTNIAKLLPVAPSGLAVAPSSVDSSVRNIYISDRGVDNGTNPNENDGVIYEISISNNPPGGTATITKTKIFTKTPTMTNTSTVTPTETSTPTETKTPTPTRTRTSTPTSTRNSLFIPMVVLNGGNNSESLPAGSKGNPTITPRPPATGRTLSLTLSTTASPEPRITQLPAGPAWYDSILTLFGL